MDLMPVAFSTVNRWRGYTAPTKKLLSQLVKLKLVTVLHCIPS